MPAGHHFFALYGDKTAKSHIVPSHKARVHGSIKADHEDVLGRDFMAQGLGHLLAAPAVAQGDGDGALGLGLAHHVLVEFGDDFRRGHVHDHIGFLYSV